jgi:hypothetical protein
LKFHQDVAIVTEQKQLGVPLLGRDWQPGRNSTAKHNTAAGGDECMHTC